MVTKAEEDIGLIALNEIEGSNITMGTLTNHINEERALEIVAGVIETGKYDQITRGVISLLSKEYPKIEEVYSKQLKLLKGNCL